MINILSLICYPNIFWIRRNWHICCCFYPVVWWVCSGTEVWKGWTYLNLSFIA